MECMLQTTLQMEPTGNYRKMIFPGYTGKRAWVAWKMDLTNVSVVYAEVEVLEYNSEVSNIVGIHESRFC